MLTKPRDKLIEVLRIQALENRLVIQHPQKDLVTHDLRIKMAEVRGEEQLDYPLSFLDDQEYLILHNIRIEDEIGYFQIDALVIYRCYLLILEAKNWYGTLLFDSDGNVIRIGDDQKEEGFTNPIVQVKLQQHRLRKWLNKNGFSDIHIPIHYFIVISHTSTIIKPSSSEEKIPSNIIHSNKLYLKIKELNQTYNQNVYSYSQCLRLSNSLIHAHESPQSNLLAKYKISKRDIQSGVRCSNCKTNMMTRNKQKWHCNSCNSFTENAHLQALLDYKLLFGNRISIRDAREFLQLESKHIVRRLLLSAGCQAYGSKRGAYYHLDNIRVVE